MKIKVYPFNLPAGGAVPILAIGSVVKIITSTGNVNLSLDDVGPVGPFSAGQGVRLGDKEFKRIVITDASGAANAGTVLVADAEFLDQTLSGVVSVIDGEKSRTLAGGMFSGSPAVAGVATQYAALQLWNPAGSGKNLIVTASDVSSSAASNPIWEPTNAAIANLYSIASANKLLLLTGAPAPVGQLRTDSFVAPSAYTGGVLKNVSIQAGGSYVWDIKGAIVVPPGKGLRVINNITGAPLSAGFEWFEESV